jgi:hypothetical protein
MADRSVELDVTLETSDMIKGVAEANKNIEKMGKGFDPVKSSIQATETQLRSLARNLDAILTKKKTPASVTNMETSYKHMLREIAEVRKADAELTKQRDAAQKTVDAAPKSSEAYKEAQAKVVRLNEQLKLSDEYVTETTKSAEQLKTTIAALRADPALTDEVANLRDRIADTTVRLGDLKQKLSDLQAAQIGKVGTSLLVAFRALETISNRVLSTFKSVFSYTKKGLSFVASTVGKIAKGIQSLIPGIRNIGEETSKATATASSGLDAVLGKLKNLLIYAIFYSVIRNTMYQLRNSMKDLLNANVEYAASMNLIKANALTAFAPLYDYILPLVISLMRTLADVMGRVAALMAYLFGMTFKQAQSAAKALYDQAKAAKAAGNAAKEAARQLMDFDEIRRLEDNKGGGGGAEVAELTFPDVDYEIPDWLKNLVDFLKKTFKPVADAFKRMAVEIAGAWKRAWDLVGPYVVAGWKHALEQIAVLAEKVFSTIADVFSSDTGTMFFVAIQKVLGQIGFIIGDIAKAFSAAWDVHGYSIVTNILKTLTNILETVWNIGQAFRAAWNENDRGARIATAILAIFDKIFYYTERISAKMRDWAANINLSPLLEAIANWLESLQKPLDAVGKVFEGFWDNFASPVLSWLIETALPKFLDIWAAFNDKVDWNLIVGNVNKVWAALGRFTENVGEGLLEFIRVMSERLAAWVNGGGFEEFMDKIAAWLDGVSAQDITNTLATLADTIAILAGALAKFAEGAIIPFLEKLVEAIGEYINSKGADGIAKDIENFVKLLISLKIASVIGSIVISIGSFVIALGKLKTAIAGSALAGPIASVGTAIGGLGTKIAGAIASVGGLSGVLSALAPVFGVLAAAIGGFALGSLIEKHWTKPLWEADTETSKWIDQQIAKFTGYDKDMAGTVTFMDTVAKHIQDGAVYSAESLKGFIDSGQITVEEAQRIANEMNARGHDIPVQFAAGIDGGIPDIEEAAARVNEGLESGLENSQQGVWDKITNVGQGLLTTFKLMFGINSPSTVMQEQGTNIIQGLINGIQTMVQSVVTAIQGLGDLIKQKIEEYKQKFFESGGALITFLKNGVTGKVSEAVTAVQGLVEKAKQKVLEFKDKFLEAGKNIIGGLIEGIKGKVEDIKAAVGNIAEKTIGFFKKAFDSNSPARKMFPVGGDVSEGLAVGIEDNAGAVDRAVNDLVDGIDADVDTDIGTSFKDGFLDQVKAVYDPVLDVFRNLVADAEGIFNSMALSVPTVNVPQLPSQGLISPSQIQAIVAKIELQNSNQQDPVYMERLDRMQEEQEVQSSLLREVVTALSNISLGGGQGQDTRSLMSSLIGMQNSEAARIGRALT